MICVYPVIIPLFAAALLAALSKLISQRLSQWIAVISALATVSITGFLVSASSNRPFVYWFGGWRPRHGIALGISFVIEPLGAGLATLTGLLLLAALVFSSKYFDTASNHFHALLLGFLAAMCGFSLTGDMFNMFVFFELMSAVAFALCAHKTDDPGSLQGALNFAVTNTIAAYFIVTGIALLYARTGALNMAQAGRTLASHPADSLVLTAFVFVVCGYLVKAAIAPFHFWLADAHAVAPSPVCILFSGVMVEVGLLALARCYWIIFAPALDKHLAGLTTLFVTIGIVTSFAGSFMCYLQRNLKRLLAFSTIGHVGSMTLGIGLFNPLGLAGSAVYVLGHAMVKAALFLVAGILLHRFGSVDERDLRGKGRSERWTAAIYLVAALVLVGTPFSGLSAGHTLIHAAAEAAGYGWLLWVLLFVSVLTSAAALRAGCCIFFGWGPAVDRSSAPKQEEKEETKQGHDHTPVAMLLPASVLVLAGMLLGFVPEIKSAAIRVAAMFEDTRGYAALVLDGKPGGPLSTALTRSPETLLGLYAGLAAMAVAGLHLFSPRIRNFAGVAGRPLRLLHQLHSGHVGDYVVFLIFGMACFALVCVYCFR